MNITLITAFGLIKFGFGIGLAGFGAFCGFLVVPVTLTVLGLWLVGMVVRVTK